MSRHHWNCRKCEWPQSSPLPARFYDGLCNKCDPRPATERIEARTKLLSRRFFF